VDAYDANKANIDQDWFVQATMNEFNANKQKIIIQKLMDQGAITASMNQAMINQAVEKYLGLDDDKKKIQAINAEILQMQNKLKFLIFSLEDLTLTQNGVTMKDVSVMKYPEKRHLYFGVSNYLNGNKEKLHDVTSQVNDLSVRLSSGEASDDDKQHLVLAKQVMTQVMLASHLKARFESDAGFMDDLRNDSVYGHLAEQMLTGVAS
jgi:hypothetical protein